MNTTSQPGAAVMKTTKSRRTSLLDYFKLIRNINMMSPGIRKLKAIKQGSVLTRELYSLTINYKI